MQENSEKQKQNEDIDEILHHHEDFVKQMIAERGEITPQVIISKDKKISVFLLMDIDRDGTAKILKYAKAVQPDWAVFFTEAYMRMYAKNHEPSPGLEHGEMAKSFKMGDPTVKEIVIVQVMKKNEKKMAFYIKENGELKERNENTEFDGYMSW